MAACDGNTKEGILISRIDDDGFKPFKYSLNNYARFYEVTITDLSASNICIDEASTYSIDLKQMEGCFCFMNLSFKNDWLGEHSLLHYRRSHELNIAWLDKDELVFVRNYAHDLSRKYVPHVKTLRGIETDVKVSLRTNYKDEYEQAFEIEWVQMPLYLAYERVKRHQELGLCNEQVVELYITREQIEKLTDIKYLGPINNIIPKNVEKSTKVGFLEKVKCNLKNILPWVS